MRFSVVIPVHKPAWFQLTLPSILHQSMSSSKYEIIIVDDCGGRANSMLMQFQDQLAQYPWRYVLCGDGCGQATARNRGLALATGEIVLFLDDDMLASPDLLETHDSYHQREFSVVMGGSPHRALTIWYPNWFNSLSGGGRKAILESGHPRLLSYIDYQPEDIMITLITILQPYDIVHDFGQVRQLAFTREHHLSALFGDELTDLAIPWITGGAGNLSVQRKLLEVVGGFDENFHGWGLEDLELEYRLHHAGARFAFITRVTAYHQLHPRQWEAMLKSNLRNYKYFCQKHPSPTVFLFFQYKMRQLPIQVYNEIAKQEQKGQLKPQEIEAAERAYQQLVTMDEEALISQVLAMAKGQWP